MANSAASNKKLQLAALSLLVLVVAAAATDQQQCRVPEEVDACVQQIKDELSKIGKMPGTPLLTPSCCKELRDQLGCACLLRDAVLKAGLDIGAPFCAQGTGCK